MNEPNRVRTGVSMWHPAGRFWADGDLYSGRRCTDCSTAQQDPINPPGRRSGPLPAICSRVVITNQLHAAVPSYKCLYFGLFTFVHRVGTEEHRVQRVVAQSPS